MKSTQLEVGKSYMLLPEVGIANFFLSPLIANPLIFF
jgi:hypothetical protein